MSHYLGTKGQRGYDPAALAKMLDAAAKVIMNNIDWSVADVYAPVMGGWSDVHLQLKCMVAELMAGSAGQMSSGGGADYGIAHSASTNPDDPLAP